MATSPVVDAGWTETLFPFKLLLICSCYGEIRLYSILGYAFSLWIADSMYHYLVDEAHPPVSLSQYKYQKSPGLLGIMKENDKRISCRDIIRQQIEGPIFE